MNKRSLQLIIMALLVLSAIASATAQEARAERAYIQIRVNGLSCPFCAYGLEKKLKKIDGQKNLHIALEEGLVTLDVPADKKPDPETIRKIVTDAGFTAKEIKFSTTPFKPEDADGE